MPIDTQTFDRGPEHWMRSWQLGRPWQQDGRSPIRFEAPLASTRAETSDAQPASATHTATVRTGDGDSFRLGVGGATHEEALDGTVGALTREVNESLGEDTYALLTDGPTRNADGSYTVNYELQSDAGGGPITWGTRSYTFTLEAGAPYVARAVSSGGATYDLELSGLSRQEAVAALPDTLRDAIYATDTGDHYLVFDEITDNGDGSYRVVFEEMGDSGNSTVSFGRRFYDVVLAEGTELPPIPDPAPAPGPDIDVEVAPQARYLSDDTGTSHADGLISGGTAADRWEDSRTERVGVFWGGLQQIPEDDLPNWSPQAALAFVLSAYQGQEGGLGAIDDATWQDFFAANFDADGNFTGAIDGTGTPSGTFDLSMFEASGRPIVQAAFEDASLLFYSLQVHHGRALGEGQSPELGDLSGALVLPESLAEADALFAAALRGEALGTGTSSFVTSGDTWQDFFVTGLSDPDSIINGDFSEQDLNNHALAKATVWVGTDIIAEYEGSGNAAWAEYWTGPSASDLDRSTLADDYKVYNVTYTRDGETIHTLVDAETYAVLQQQHRAGEIVLGTDGIQEIATDATVGWNFQYLDEDGALQTFDGGGLFGAGTVDDLMARHNAGKIVILAPQVTDQATLKLFWSQKALALHDVIRTPQYDASGSLISGADSTTRLAHAFAIMKDYYQPATAAEGFRDRAGRARSGTRIEPLLRTDAIATTPQMTDAEARDVMFTALGIGQGIQPDLYTVLQQQRGVSNIADVAGHWAQRQHHHPDHDYFFGGHGNEERSNHAYDIVSLALTQRGRDAGGIDLARDDTNTDISVGRVIDGLGDVALILSLGTDAAFVTGVRVTLGEAGIEVAEQELVPLVGRGVPGAAAEGGTFRIGGATVSYSAEEYAAAQLAVDSGTTGATESTILARIGFGAGAGWDVVSRLGAEFGTGELSYTSAGAAGFKIVEMTETGPVIVAEAVPGDAAGPAGSAGLTPVEQLRVAFIAGEVTETYHQDGAAAATNLLLTHGLRPDAGMVLEVLQYLDEEVRVAVEGQLAADAETHLEAFGQVIGSGDLDDPAILAEVVTLLDAAPPAAASAALEFIRTAHGEAAAVTVMQAMDPEQVAKVLVHDMAFSLYAVRDGGRSAPELPANVTTFAALAGADPERAGEILTAVVNEDVDVGGHLVLTLARIDGAEAISEALVHTDSVEAAKLMSEALEIESHGQTDWDPIEDSVVLDVSVELLNEGNDLLMSGKVNATFAAFVVLQPTLTLSAEEDLINEASQSNLVEISSLLGDPLSFLDALGGDEGALEVAADGLERLGVDEAADAIVDHFGGDGGGGDGPPSPSSSPLGGVIRHVDDRFAASLFTTLNEKSPETVADLFINETDPDNPLGFYREDNLLEWFKYLGPADSGRIANLIDLELTRRGATEGNAWEEANRNPFETVVNEYLENLPARHAAEFVAELSPEQAAAYLGALDPAQAAAILEEMVNSGNLDQVGAILGHMAETSPASAAGIVRHMTFNGAARALEALETLRAQDPSSDLPGAKAILDEIPEAEAAAILSRMDQGTAVNIFAQTEGGEDYNRMFRIHGLMDAGGNQNAVARAGIPGGPADGGDPTAGLVDEDDADDIDAPIYLTQGIEAPITGYGGTLADGTPFILANVQNPAGDTIVTEGQRRLVLGQNENGFYYIPVDETGASIPGYVVRYDSDDQSFIAQRTPQGFAAAPLAGGPQNPIQVGPSGTSPEDFASQYDVVMEDVFVPADFQVRDGAVPIGPVSWRTWNFPHPGPNPLPVIREQLAEFQTTPPDERSANYLSFLVGELGPDEANALTLDERWQVMQIIVQFGARVTPDVARILGTRPADPFAAFVPGDRLPQGPVRDFVDGQIGQLTDLIYAQFLGPLTRTTPMTLEEANDYVHELVELVANFYGIPVPPIDYSHPDAGAAFFRGVMYMHPEELERIQNDPFRAVTIVVHELTHGYQHGLLGASTPPDVGTPQWALMQMSRFAGRVRLLHPNASSDPNSSGYYYRALDEVHAYYVEEGVSIGLADRLNAQNGRNIGYYYRPPGDGTALILRMLNTEVQPPDPQGQP